jgi:hypothetical protein
MVGALDPLAVGQHPCVLRDGVLLLPRGAERRGEAGSRRDRLGMVAAVHPLLVGHHPLVLPDRLP